MTVTCAHLPSQIDNEGTPNGLTLGAFLADEETKAVMRDQFCVKTLSYKASLLGPYIPKEEAIANSENWTLAAPESDDDEPPQAGAGVFDPCLDEASSSSARSPEPPATVVGGKRKAPARRAE